MKPFAYVVFDGERLSSDPHATGRRLRIDSRCIDGAPVEGAFANVCALPGRESAAAPTGAGGARLGGE